ncbi:hypothetical protein ACFLSA_02025 [Bacteroidota bacterium]
MKKLIISVLVIISSFGLYAQDYEFKTILGSDDIRLTGFGGPFMQFSQVDGKFAHFMGGGGGLILNDKLILGGFGNGMTNAIEATKYNEEDHKLEFGYGGLWFAYIISGRQAIHPVIHLQTGWGGINLIDQGENSIQNDFVTVFTPIIELEMNITQFFRMAIGASYRYTVGVGAIDGYTDDMDFSGPGGFLSFKFGWF